MTPTRFFGLQRRWVFACVAALAACGGGDDTPGGAPGGGNPGGGAPPPPPSVQSVTVTPASATLDPGQAVTFTAVARDAAGSAVSATFTWSTSDAAIATIDANGVATGVAAGSVTVHASTGGITSSGAALTVRTPAPTTGASSEELIAAALAAGTIDAPTALAYRVYASYRDARLPAPYRGNDTNVTGELTAKAELDAAFDTLPPALQDQLAPFLMRPSSIGSWRDPNPPANQRVARAGRNGVVRPQARLTCLGVLSNWQSVAPPTAGVRVWYDRNEVGHDQVAAYVAARIEAKAWPVLITQLGFLPPLDDRTIVGCDGGDSRLDIYIVEQAGRGFTYAESSPSYDRNRWSTYIELNARLGPHVMEHAIAHELAHAIHRAYPTAGTKESYGWFMDAFANWAALQAEPGNLSVAEQASCVFRSSWLPLDDRAEGHCSPRGNPPIKRDYGAFVPLEYISRTRGAATVKRILEETATASSAFQAMETVFGSSFNDVWKDYALTLWNQELIRSRPASFFNWNGFDNAPELARDLPAKVDANLNGAPAAETALEKNVDNMSVKFYHFTFSEEKTRSLMFHNTWNVNRRNNQKVSVQALFKAEGGQWTIEDWTDYEWIGFCRDAKEQRLEQLVVVVASAEWRQNNATPVVQAAEIPRLMRNNIGCWAYEGVLRRTYSDGSWSGGSTVTQVTARYDSAPFGRPPQYTDRATHRLRVPIATPLFQGASLQYVDSHGENGCSYSTNVSRSEGSVVAGGNSASTIVLNNFLDALPDDIRASQVQLTGPAERSYVGNGVTNLLLTGSVSGPQPQCGTQYTSAVGAWWLTRAMPETPPQVAADGRLVGTYQVNGSGDNFSEVFTWDLAPVRQP